LPRSAAVNLTVDVFGQSVNLLEAGARAEGFEDTVEELFGPEGVFKEDTLQKILRGMRREKRETDAAADFRQTFNEYRHEEPRGNYFLRVFGRDVNYGSFRGLSELAGAAPSAEVDFARSSVFLDGGITLPTSSGLPLDVAVNGSYNVAFRSEVNVDWSHLLQRGLFSGETSASLAVYPTATVEVVGAMTVKTPFITAGLK